MPLYSFINTKTKKTFEEFFSISAKEEYLTQNPHIHQTFDKVNFASSATGNFKNDDGWKENLDRIAEAHPSSAFAQKQKRKTAKELKTDKVLKKHNVKRGRANYNMDL